MGNPEHPFDHYSSTHPLVGASLEQHDAAENDTTDTDGTLDELGHAQVGDGSSSTSWSSGTSSGRCSTSCGGDDGAGWACGRRSSRGRGGWGDGSGGGSRGSGGLNRSRERGVATVKDVEGRVTVRRDELRSVQVSG